MSGLDRTLPRVAARGLSARVVLGALVGAGTLVHTLLARTMTSPSVFPDEYLYAQLARSFAHTGQFRVRGLSAHFLPLLQPVLTSVAWLGDDVGRSYRLVQAENALAMSLCAIPVYLIARRLRIDERVALAAAGLTVFAPTFMFTGMILSEPFAYPLTLTVVAILLRVVERPTLRSQALLVALCGLTMLARLQLGAVALAAVVAVVGAGLRERRLGAAVRELPVLVGAIVLTFAAGVTIGVVHGFGYYKLAVAATDLPTALRIAGVDAYVIVLAAGVAVVPSAIVAIALAVARPRFRAELVFAGFVTSFTAAELLQSVLWGDTQLVQERYLGYAVPLLAIACALRFDRGNRRATAELAVATAVIAAASALPLAGYAIDDRRSLAPTLYAFQRLNMTLGDPSTTALVFALVATVLAGAGVLCARMRWSAAVPMLLAAGASGAILIGATSWSGRLGTDARERLLPADAGWVDAAVAGPKTMVVVGRAWEGASLATLFWNPSVTHAVRLFKGAKLARLADPAARVDARGVVHVGGTPLTGTVVVESSPFTSVTLRDSTLQARGGPGAVWTPRAAVALGSIVENRMSDGRVLRSGSIRVWGGPAQLAGWILVRASLPQDIARAYLQFGSRAGFVRVPLRAGDVRVLRVPACGTAPWHGGYSSDALRATGSTWTSVSLGTPRYVPDVRACR